MKDNDSSERHQRNALKVVIAYAKFLGSDTSFYDVKHREQITNFLDTKIKSLEQDPDKKWITTWNHYFHRIKHLFRWLYKQRGTTPAFAKIKEKRTKRQSPYSETLFQNTNKQRRGVKHLADIKKFGFCKYGLMIKNAHRLRRSIPYPGMLKFFEVDYPITF